MKLTKEIKRKYHVDLLLISEEEKRHYILIRNLSGLFNDKAKQSLDNRVFPCRYCFQRLSTAERLERHVRDCEKHSPQVILYPKPAIMGKRSDESESEVDDFEQQFLDETAVQSSIGHATNFNDCGLNRPYTYTREEDYDIRQDRSKLCFKSLNKIHSVPFCFYLDFESYLVKSVDKYDREIHIPSGFCCLRVSRYSRFNDEKAYLYSGPNVMQHFYEHMHYELEKIDKILEIQLPMTIDPETQAKFKQAKTCYTCSVKFDKNQNIACRHHDHITSEYLAAVCRNCNLQLKPSKLRNNMNKKFFGNQFFIPVICHNMKNYDADHILKHLTPIFKDNPEKFANVKDIDVIANNMDRYIGFQMGALRFLDSLQFLNASLETLVSNLTKDGLDKLVYTKRHFDQEQIPFVSRKGIFPYSWFDGEQRMTETQLPPQSDFYSNLTEEGVSDSDYLHAQNVWNQFQMTSFKQYHDLYLQTDVLLLSDVFEQFRSFAKNTYDLDPLHYYTLPGFSWEAMLKMTTTCGNTDHLDLITEPEQFLFIEKGIRGGISMISNRHAVANNPDVPKYDPSKPTNWQTYLDANYFVWMGHVSTVAKGEFPFPTPQ